VKEGKSAAREEAVRKGYDLFWRLRDRNRTLERADVEPFVDSVIQAAKLALLAEHDRSIRPQRKDG
jgi:hypothetical protein